MKKYIFIIICLFFNLNLVYANNPYGKYQQLYGVQTVRCTYYAWQQAYDNTKVEWPNFGNARNWYDNAKKAGYQVGSKPKIKSIAVFDDGVYGHVAYVTSVDGNNITVNEAGVVLVDLNGNYSAYNGDGIYKGRTINNLKVGKPLEDNPNLKLLGYIYLDEPVKESHVHNYGDFVIIKEATCQEEGLKERVCSCGKKETEKIPKLEHTYGEIKTKLENNQEITYQECEICSEINILEEKEHIHQYGEWEIIKNPTSQEEGEKTKTCLFEGCNDIVTMSIPKLEKEFPMNNILIGGIILIILLTVILILNKKLKKH